jgi:hypothetical protein
LHGVHLSEGSAPLVLIGVYKFTGGLGTFKLDLLKALLSECTRIRAEGKFPVLVGDFNTSAKRILREQENMKSRLAVAEGVK